MSAATGPAWSSPAASIADERPSDERARLVVGLCAITAGTVHLAVAPHHLGESIPVGLAFVALGVVQLAIACAVSQVERSTTLLGVLVLHVGAVAAYVASRTVELPFLPPHDAGHLVDHLPVAGGVGDGIPVVPGSRIEPVGVLDLACVAAELVLVIVVASMLPARARRWASTTALLAAAALVLARLAWGVG